MSESELIRQAGKLRAEYLRELFEKRRYWLSKRRKRTGAARTEPHFKQPIGDAAA